MRLNERGSLFTGLLGSKSERKRIRRATFYVLFMLSTCAGMIMTTRDRAFFRVSETLHFDAIIFLVLISWIVAGMSYRGPRKIIAPALISTVGLGCLIIGPIWISANAASTMTARVVKLKTLHQATMLYAGDH
jgi:hypothetical protein